MLGNVKIGTKLIGGFLIVLLLLVVSAVMSYTSMQTAKTNAASMYTDRLVPVNQLKDVQQEIFNIRGDLFKLEVVPAEMAGTKTNVQASIVIVNDNLKDYKATTLLASETAGLAIFEPAWAAYQAEIVKATALADAGKWDTFTADMQTGGSTSNARKAVDAAVQSLVDINVTEAARLQTATAAAASQSNMITIVLAVLSVIFGVAIALVLSKSITGPINKVKNALSKMAMGDISEKVNITSKDEVGMMAQASGAMQLYMQETAGAAQQIAAGELHVTIKPKSEQDV
ncbi:MAG: MCP four helix bundle domain-containing protein, partial [bacterium]